MRTSVRVTSALIFACAVSAFAQSAAPQASFHPAAQSASEARATQEYWTPERLASAVPMPLPKVDRTGVSEATVPSAPGAIHSAPGGQPTLKMGQSVESQQERFPLSQGTLNQGTLNQEPEAEMEAEMAAPEAFTYEMPFNNFRPGNNTVYPYSTVGKLFFTVPAGASEPAGTYVCSAAVALDSHTVVTARHCMFDIGKQLWYSNWVFYPGWNNGSNLALGGAWYPSFAYAYTSSTTLSLTTGYDIGLLSMHDSTRTGCGGDTGSYTIGQFTGWLGYTYGGDFTQRQWNTFGYPQATPFEGNYLYQDNGATGAVNPSGSTNVVEIGNPQTGGSSGGPWIVGFDPSGATDVSPNNNTSPGLYNLINGVNSFVWTSPAQPLAMNGAIFQSSNFWNLYTNYKTQTCK